MPRLFDAALPRTLKTPGELPKSRGQPHRGAAWEGGSEITRAQV
jgi:hypothetical protein